MWDIPSHWYTWSTHIQFAMGHTHTCTCLAQVEYTHTHMRHAYANLCGHTWMHIKHNCTFTYIEYTEMHTQIYSYPWAHTPKDLNKQPPPTTLRHIWTHLWDTCTGPTHPYGTHSDEEHSVSLRPVSCPSLSSRHNRALAPICSGLYQFALPLYAWNQASESSELRNKMDTQGGMCYSRLYHSNKT